MSVSGIIVELIFPAWKWSCVAEVPGHCPDFVDGEWDEKYSMGWCNVVIQHDQEHPGQLHDQRCDLWSRASYREFACLSSQRNVEPDSYIQRFIDQSRCPRVTDNFLINREIDEADE